MTYSYPKRDRPLSELQQDFIRDGFVVLPRLVPDTVLNAIHRAITRLVNEHDFTQHQSVFRTDDQDQGRDDTFFASAYQVQGFLEAEAVDDQGNLCVEPAHCLNKIGHALHDLVPEFTNLARSTWIRDAFATGGLNQTNLIQSMIIFKQPQIGGQVRWHQDASYLLTQPASVVGVWVALEKATRNNGCLWMSPGAHHTPLRERYHVDWQERVGTLTMLDDTPWPNAQQAVALEVEAGSVVVFHDHMPHCSYANRSDQSRVAVTFHGYHPQSTWSLNNWLQRSHLDDFII